MKQSYTKHLPTGFEESANSMGTEELRDLVVKSSKEIKGIEGDRKADITRQHLMDDLKDINGGYNDAIKTYKAKISLALDLLASRGTNVTLAAK